MTDETKIQLALLMFVMWVMMEASPSKPVAVLGAIAVLAVGSLLWLNL